VKSLSGSSKNNTSGENYKNCPNCGAANHLDRKNCGSCKNRLP
jgi:ribosomal protein S27AE